MAPTDRNVTGADGVEIAFRDHGGDGRGLVRSHGGGANLVSMDQFAARLARRVAPLRLTCAAVGSPVTRTSGWSTPPAMSITVVDALARGPSTWWDTRWVASSAAGTPRRTRRRVS